MADKKEFIVNGKPLSTLRVVDLKQELEKRSLSKSGSKKDLVEKLKMQLKLESLSEEAQSSMTKEKDIPNVGVKSDVESDSLVEEYYAEQQAALNKQLEMKRQIMMAETVPEPAALNAPPLEIIPLKDDKEFVQKCDESVDLTMPKKESSNTVHVATNVDDSKTKHEACKVSSRPKRNQHGPLVESKEVIDTSSKTIDQKDISPVKIKTKHEESVISEDNAVPQIRPLKTPPKETIPVNDDKVFLPKADQSVDLTISNKETDLTMPKKESTITLEVSTNLSDNKKEKDLLPKPEKFTDLKIANKETANIVVVPTSSNDDETKHKALQVSPRATRNQEKQILKSVQVTDTPSETKSNQHHSDVKMDTFFKTKDEQSGISKDDAVPQIEVLKTPPIKAIEVKDDKDLSKAPISVDGKKSNNEGDNKVEVSASLDDSKSKDEACKVSPKPKPNQDKPIVESMDTTDSSLETYSKQVISIVKMDSYLKPKSEKSPRSDNAVPESLKKSPSMVSKDIKDLLPKAEKSIDFTIAKKETANKMPLSTSLDDRETKHEDSKVSTKLKRNEDEPIVESIEITNTPETKSKHIDRPAVKIDRCLKTKSEESIVSEKCSKEIENKSDAIGNSDSSKNTTKAPRERKRRWGSTLSTSSNTSSANIKNPKGISTDSLKVLIPDLDKTHTQVSHKVDEIKADNTHTSPTLTTIQVSTPVFGAGPTNVGQSSGKGSPNGTPGGIAGIVGTPLDKRDVRVIRKPMHEEKDEESIRKMLKQSEAPKEIAIPEVTDEIKGPTPPRNPQSDIISIRNLVRPFTLLQLMEVLGRSGVVQKERFWIDKIKSKCYAAYENEEQAVAARTALHGIKWPDANPKNLVVDFAKAEELEYHKNLEIVKPANKPDLGRGDSGDIVRKIANDQIKDKNKSSENLVDGKDQKVVDSRPIREWDKDKFKRKSDEIIPSKRKRSLSPVDKRRSANEAEKDSRRKESPRRADRSAKKDKPQEQESPAKLLDDLFRKTKAIPCIYWLPLNEEQAEKRAILRLEIEKKRENERVSRDAERKKRMEEEMMDRGRERRYSPPRNRRGRSPPNFQGTRGFAPNRRSYYPPRRGPPPPRYRGRRSRSYSTSRSRSRSR